MAARLMIAAAAAMLLTGCGETKPDAAQAEAPEALSPGEYEASWTVASLQSTDKTTPATELKADETGTSKGCVDAGGTIDPAIFAEGKDECKASNSYVRNGRINVQMTCRRSGGSGSVMQSVSGTSTADGFQAEVSTSTYLAERGNYNMVRKLTARRLGECPPPAADETADS